MGDFNIDLLKTETCSLTGEFFETMMSYSLCPNKNHLSFCNTD